MQPHYSPEEIAHWVGARCLGEGPQRTQPICTFAFDTRTLPLQLQGTTFVALAGPQRDGHAYLPAAYQAGVRVFWVQRIPAECAQWPGAVWLVQPNDTPVLHGLQRLAAHHRRQWGGRLVAVAGSNGKTMVKEWLATLLEGHCRVLRSPGSYNSQLGVALATLELRPEHQVAVLEAGISQPGEMQRLADMLQPTAGIFTHFGDAHQENFASPEAKLAEKLRLFGPQTEWVATLPREAERIRPLAPSLPLQLPSQAVVQRMEALHDVFGSPAERENATLAAWAALLLGVPQQAVFDRLPHLGPVSMRLELITENPEITLLNDAYNADAASVQNAFAWLAAQHSQPRRVVILSDLEHQGPQQRAIQAQLASEAVARFGGANVWLVGPVFAQMGTNELASLGANPVASVEALLRHTTYDTFAHCTVLLKGARRFALERLVPRLSLQATSSELRVDLDALRHNTAVYRATLPPQTRLLAMLKAQGYGSGDWQLAQELARLGFDAVGVALTAEGIRLRRRGIQLPILVLNPDPDTLDLLAPHALQPVVGQLSLLHAVLAQHSPPALHLEFDTGMARLGFLPDELPAVLQALAAHPEARVAGIMTHLASAEDPTQREFTHQQLQAFAPLAQAIKARYPAALAHASNSAGALAFAPQAFDMVRLGIGLYGLATGSPPANRLREVCTLATRVVQVRQRPAGTPIGYGCSQVLQRPTPVATLGIGYADGVPRALSNGVGYVLLHGKPCPILGRVCMDMLMVDATNAPNVKPGDEAVVFGTQAGVQLSLRQVAQAAGTIPYEILTHLSPRLRRVYVRE